jgi:PAS domain S-box-containing protein
MNDEINLNVCDRQQPHAQLEQELQHERNFIAAVLETIGALVVVLDLSGKIVRFNKACEHVSGYQADDIKGQIIWERLISPEETPKVQSVFQELEHGKPSNHHENYWICKDGTRRLIRWSNTVLKNSSGQVDYVIGTGIDITEQRQAEQQVIRHYKQGKLLGEITRKIRQSLDINEILQTAVDEVQAHLACNSVLIIQYDSHDKKKATGKVIQESTHNQQNLPSLLNRTVAGLKRSPAIETLSLQSWTCSSADSASTQHTLAPSCSLYSAEFLAQCQVQACIEVPVYVGNDLWGLIIASECDRPRQWDAFEIDLMQQLANQMGVALSQAQFLNHLEAQVQHRHKQVLRTNKKLKQEIQERIKTEEALRESQQRLSGILENADDAIISIDEHHHIILYNRGAEQVFGYSADEVLGHPLDILLPDAFRLIHRQHIDTFSAASEEPRPMGARNRPVFGKHKTGTTFPAEASISKLQTQTGPIFTVMLKDITERCEAEAALKRSEENLRVTTDAMPALICYVDQNEQYQFVNKTYEEWFNLSINNLQGRHVKHAIGSAYNEIKPYIARALAGEKVCFEVDMTTPDGKSRSVLARYIPDIDDQGTVKGFFGLVSDISDRKATERMKDEFISVVGHELRTPLTSIHGSLKLLATRRLGTLSPQGQEMVDIALKNTDRLTRLINDVLDLERIESGRVTMAMQPCDVGDLMMQATQAMQSMANSYNVHLSTQPLSMTLMVDPDHITQALTNLLSNAIKFSSEGSTVWLGATDQQTDIVLSVRDHGRGIPEEKIDLIFNRFQQVDSSDSRERGGTGLGLAICKKIAQEHNGKIWVESIFGQGSTFFLQLPKHPLTRSESS